MEETSKPIDSSVRVARARSVYRGAIVAVVGPDGTGKSTTIDELQRLLTSNGSIVSSNIRHWRPAVFPPLGRLTPKGGAASQFGGPPRRSPGRFQFLRVAYYGLDFIVGHIVQDNPEKRQGGVILYDRCALDMRVDPVRFGLKSTRGTGLLWRVVRKPDAIVLLYDSPARILARKAELSGEELERQFAVWCKLLAEEQVGAVVRINSKPAEIAHRIASYLEGNSFEDANNSAVPIARRQMLDVVRHMLAGDPIGVASNSAAATNSNPQVSQYAVIPSLSSPRFLVPLGSRRSGASSLTAYSAHKPLARAFKLALQKGLGVGLAQPLLRQRILIRDSGTDAEAVNRRTSLRNYLAQALGKIEVFLGVSLGTPSPHQKPLFQVMDRGGRALGYAKIGWNEETIRIVQNEAQALLGLADREFTNASMPRALLAEYWNGYYILLQSGPPSEKWSPSRDITASHVQFLKELNQINHAKEHLQESQWWQKLQKRAKALDAMGAAYDADLVRWALDECAMRFGETDVFFGMKHGDFTPWNLLEKDGELFVLDWEYADSHAPFGSDILHFAIQRAALVIESRPKNTERDLLGNTAFNRRLRGCFADSGIEVSLIDSYLALYAADALSWHLWRDQGRKDRKSVQTRDAWRYILVNYIHRHTLTGTSMREGTVAD